MSLILLHSRINESLPLNMRVDSFQDSHLVLNPQDLQYMIFEFYTTEDIKILQ